MTAVAMEEPFRVGRVFTKSFDICCRRFVPLLRITAIASIPLWSAVALMAPLMQRSLGAERILFFDTVQVLRLLVTSMVMQGVMEELSGRRFLITDSVTAALRDIAPLTGIAIATAIAMSFGAVPASQWELMIGPAWIVVALVLTVPGVMVACMWYVSMPACIVERIGLQASMSRSAFLTSGCRWQVFGFNLLIGIISWVLSALALATLGPIAGQLWNYATSTVLDAVYGVVACVCYHELRLAKGGFDLKSATVFD